MPKRKSSNLANRTHRNAPAPERAKRKPRLPRAPTRSTTNVQSQGAAISHPGNAECDSLAPSRRERLEVILRDHSTPELLDRLEQFPKTFREHFRAGKPKTLSKIRTEYVGIRKAAEGLRKRIAGLDGTSKVTLNVELLSRGWRIVPVADLSALMARLSEDLSVVLARPLDAYCHRPLDYQRQFFAQIVARHLCVFGVPLTATRRGIFAKVLAVLLEDAGFPSRDDLRSLLRAASEPLVHPVPNPSYPRFAQPRAGEPPVKGEVRIALTEATATDPSS